MNGAEFPIEKTKFGYQYLIPGTEVRYPEVPKKKYYKLEGNQYCLPGTDRKLKPKRKPKVRRKRNVPRSKKLSIDNLDFFKTL